MKSNNKNKLKHLVSIREYLLTNINSNKNFNLRKLSKLLGRNDAYLQQYIKRGSPNYLPEEERIQLCHILKIEVNDLTPSWLRINDNLYSDSYKISIENKCKDFILISKKLFKNLNFSKIDNLCLQELILNEVPKNHSFIRVIVDKGITNFEDENDYILDDKNNLFLAHLSLDTNFATGDQIRIIVKPYDNQYSTFRIDHNKLKIFGKIIFKSKKYKIQSLYE